MVETRTFHPNQPQRLASRLNSETMETPKEKQERKARAAKQLKSIGYVSLKNRYSPEQFEKAIRMSCGSVKAVCLLLKCNQNEFFVFLNSNMEMRTIWDEVRQTQLDRAEEVVDSLLDSKNEKIRLDAAKYILSNRHLDYKQKQNVQEVNVGKDGSVSIRSVFGLSEDE